MTAISKKRNQSSVLRVQGTMKPAAYAIFETAIGSCGIAWGDRGIRRVWLPESDADGLRREISRTLPGAIESEPPPEVARAVAGIVRLLSGTPADLSDVALDLADVPVFHRSVYAIAREIPPGATLSYGEIAKRLGDPTRARAVGQALGANPFPLVVPCHRVLAANGKAGGFSAPGGVPTKLRLLEIEGARAPAIPTLFD